jgi:hypothetical protein
MLPYSRDLDLKQIAMSGGDEKIRGLRNDGSAHTEDGNRANDR